jgi:regulator of cell morphogenesis and NO signaling
MAETIPKEHDAIVNALEIFRELTRSYTMPNDGDFLFKYLFEKMKRLDREMSFHMHLENTILFPKAIALAKELKKQGGVPYIFWKEHIELSKS